MIRYLFTLDFQFDRELCNLDPTLKPLMTPEGIAGSHSVNGYSGNVGVHCQKEVHGELGQCIAQMTHEVSDASDDSDMQLIADQLMGLFSHLPGFCLVSLDYKKIDLDTPTDAEIDAAPIETGAPMKPFTVQCLFRSNIPHLELMAMFMTNIYDGKLVGNGNISNEFVAIVHLSAVSSASIKEAVEALLARAFGTDAQNSSDCFFVIKTTLL